MQPRHAFPKAFGMGRGVYVPTIMRHPQTPADLAHYGGENPRPPVLHAAGADASHRRGFTCQLAGRSAQLPLPVPERRRGGRLRSYQKKYMHPFCPTDFILQHFFPPTPINILEILIFHICRISPYFPYFASFCIFES